MAFLPPPVRVGQTHPDRWASPDTGWGRPALTGGNVAPFCQEGFQLCFEADICVLQGRQLLLGGGYEDTCGTGLWHRQCVLTTVSGQR